MREEKYFDDNGFEVAIGEDRYGGSSEGWFRKEESEWIRLDFFLEFYLTKNVVLSKRFKGQLKSFEKSKEYSILLLDKLKELTNNGSEFDFEKYGNWIRSKSETKVAIALFVSN